MPAARKAAAAVPVPTSFPMLVSPSHKRYTSAIGSLNDSYARTAAAQQRRQHHQQQQARRDAHLAQLAQHSAQQQLDRQFLFREHVLATVNHSKARRIRLECSVGLREAGAMEGSADWPRFDTVEVRVEDWRCSGAKTRVLEEEGWRDETKAQLVAERVEKWQRQDRERELQKRREEQQQRHSAIHARFMQQREVNDSRAAYIRHHFTATQPHHLTPPASYLDSVRGRHSRADERRDGEDEQASGRGSVLSTGRSSEKLPWLSHRSMSATTAGSLPAAPVFGRRRPSLTQPTLPTIVDDDSQNRRHTISHAPDISPASAPVSEEAAAAVEQREDDYDDSTFDLYTTNTLPSKHAHLAPSSRLSLEPSSPFHADDVAAIPAPLLSTAVDSDLQRFESKLPAVRERDKQRDRPLYLTNHQRQHR